MCSLSNPHDRNTYSCIRRENELNMNLGPCSDENQCQDKPSSLPLAYFMCLLEKAKPGKKQVA